MTVAVLVACLTTAAPAFAEFNASGTWKAVYHCEVGGCKGGNYPAEPTFVQEKGSSVVHQEGAPSVVASVQGNVLTIEDSSSGYKFKQSATISADCQSWSGTLSDSNGTSGTDTATRVSGSCEGQGGESKEAKEAKERKEKEEREKAAKHPTGTQVICNYEFATFQNVCVAAVGDGAATPTTPTGIVTFTTTSGGFASGARCSLQASATSPTVSSCTLTYITANSGLPSITATYSGDATHAASAGSTQYLGGGGPEETTGESVPSAPGQYPNEVVLETTLPAAAMSVEAAVQALGHKLTGEALKLPAIPPGLDPQSAMDLALLGSVAKDVSGAVGDIAKEAPILDGDIQKALGRVGELLQSPTPANQADGKILQKQTTEILERLNKTLKKQSEAEQEAIKNAGGAAFGAAIHKKVAKRRTRSVKSLAYVIRRNVSGGKLKLRLHIDRAALAKLAGKHNSVRVLLRVTVHLASALTPAGETRVIVKRITLKRAPRAHKKH
ncbi:MAG: Ig-like domain repeat protein [Solirubrobacterales bacterium]|nr:Ig-like domain repeat protein [Solirubrobacterales bacterium]